MKQQPRPWSPRISHTSDGSDSPWECIPDLKTGRAAISYPGGSERTAKPWGGGPQGGSQ